jgi:hypothetical protein
LGIGDLWDADLLGTWVFIIRRREHRLLRFKSPIALRSRSLVVY